MKKTCWRIEGGPHSPFFVMGVVVAWLSCVFFCNWLILVYVGTSKSRHCLFGPP